MQHVSNQFGSENRVGCNQVLAGIIDRIRTTKDSVVEEGLNTTRVSDPTATALCAEAGAYDRQLCIMLTLS